MSTQKILQWVKDNGALAFLLSTQSVVLIGVFVWLAVSTVQSMQQPAKQAPEVLAKQLPASPTVSDPQRINAQPAAAAVK